MFKIAASAIAVKRSFTDILQAQKDRIRQSIRRASAAQVARQL